MSGEQMHERATYGKYRVIAKLGRGGMATVYLAVDQGPAGFNKLKVVKCLHPATGADSEEQLNMFLDEIRLTALLNHRNIVQAYEVGQEGDTYFLVMEYLEGQTYRALQTRSARIGEPMPRRLKLRILSDVLNGLHHAHEMKHHDGSKLNIVHRDVTPHNVFVTYDGGVKVVDFGIAKTAISSVETRADVIKGKVPYMAPEQLKAGSVDRRADIFQVGIMLWEAATGERFWGTDGDLLILSRLTNNLLPTIAAGTPGMDGDMARICSRALAYLPADRYATADELRRDVEAYMEKTGNQASAEEAGNYAAQLFADKRAEIKAHIEEDLKRVNAVPLGVFSSVPTIQTTSYSTTAESKLSEAPADSADPPPRQSGSGPRSVSETLSAAYGTASPATETASPSATNRRALLGLAVAGAVGIAATLVLLSRTGSSGARESPSSTVSAHEVAAAPVKVRVSAKPDGASLFLDDAPLGGSPFTGQFSRDRLSHRIRVEAPGHAPRSAVVIFDKDVELDIALEPRPEPGPSAAGPAGASAAPSASPAGAQASRPSAPARPVADAKPAADAKPLQENKPPPETPPKKDKLQLDNTDPWKQ